MSKDLGTLPQAAHLLNVVVEQGLNAPQVEILHPLLSALAQAVAQGKAPALDDFRNMLGLNKFLGEPVQFTYPPLSEPIDPFAFFQTREGLWVDQDFIRWILPAAEKLSALPEHPGHYNPLLLSANDGEIRGESSQDYVWTASEWCARFAERLEQQWKNKAPGDLLSNGFANISHVGINGEVFTVVVSWNADRGRWRVYARRLNDLRWADGRRVFPRN